MSDPFYSLYCKQREIERCWHTPWACGFASMVTCFRLLGDRTTDNNTLVQEFRGLGGKPRDGMTTDEAATLARAFGYRPTINRSESRLAWPAFVKWLESSFARRAPVMLSVDSNGEQGEADHWWIVYGDPQDSKIWVMDPFDDDTPFDCFTRKEICKYAACDDGNGFLEYDGVSIAAPLSMGMVPVPPSATLMEFLNEDLHCATGWRSEAIAAALVDNHFSSVQDLPSQGAVRSGATLVSTLLECGGAVDEVLDEWDVFFTDQQEANIESLRILLYDVEAHMSHKINSAEKDHITHEIALNLILIGTNLMDE